MKPLFRYTFQAANDYYYYIDNLGNVQTSLYPKYLTDDPNDWQNTQVSFDRNEDAHGIFRKSTIPLQFHNDAAKILRYIYYNDTFNGYCKFTVEKQNRDFVSNNWLYATWFISEVDFGQSQDGDFELPPGDVFFQVRLMELGLPAVLDNHKDDTFEIPIYTDWGATTLDADAVEIEVKDITMDSHYEWVAAEDKDTSNNPVFNPGDYSPTFAALKSQQVYEVIDQTSQIDIGAGVYQTYFAMATQNNTATINVNFEGQYTNLGTSGTVGYALRRIIFDKSDPVNPISNTVIWTDTQNLATNQVVDFTITDNLTTALKSGNSVRYKFFVVSTSPPQAPAVRIKSDGLVTIDSVFVTPASRMFGFPYKALAQKLLNKMAGNTNYTVQSNLLDDVFLDYFTRPNKNIVVPAASIRQLDDPKIKTSWSELMSDLRTMFGIGWGVEGNTLRIEKAAYFYNKNINLHTISSNTTVQKATANDFIYNRIKIGFNDTSVDEINGLQEFCCEHEYNCGLTAPTVGSKELNLVSPYIHGLYSIENIRSYLFRSDTTSTPTDNETCVIEINVGSGGVWYPAQTGFNGTTFNTGVKYPADIYNTGHSPKACLIRNLDYIKSFLRDGQVITFNTATKNAELSYGDASVTLIENSNIEITSTGAKIPATSNLYPNINRMFLPFTFQFTGEVPENLLALMETADSGSFKKYGELTVYDGKIELKMFVLDIGVTPGTDDAYQIRGLCSPNTNLQNLIQ